jgi:hypothetical protein
MPTPIDQAMNSRVSPTNKELTTRTKPPILTNVPPELLLRLRRPRNRSRSMVDLGRRHVPPSRRPKGRPPEVVGGRDAGVVEQRKFRFNYVA